MDNTQFYRDSSSTASFFVPRHKVSYILPNQVMQSCGGAHSGRCGLVVPCFLPGRDRGACVLSATV